LIRNEIHQDRDNGINFDLLAQRFNLGYTWFRKTLKEVLGTSPNHYHMILKLRKAEQLIQKTNLTMAEIEHRSGFDSELYFSGSIKKKINYNASDIRKSRQRLIQFMRTESVKSREFTATINSKPLVTIKMNCFDGY